MSILVYGNVPWKLYVGIAVSARTWVHLADVHIVCSQLGPDGLCEALQSVLAGSEG